MLVSCIGLPGIIVGAVNTSLLHQKKENWDLMWILTNILCEGSGTFFQTGLQHAQAYADADADGDDADADGDDADADGDADDDGDDDDDCEIRLSTTPGNKTAIE